MAPTPVVGTTVGTAQTTASKVARWVEENAIAIALGAAVVGGGAGAYYYLSQNKSTKPPGPSSEPSASSKKNKAKKKKKAGGSAGASLKEKDGPLLNEAPDTDLFNLSEDEIRRLPVERRKSLAQALKAAGNKAYTSQNLEKAAELYTKGIAADPLAVFYSNRAACYLNLGKYDEVIQDCNSALKMDKTYVKALNRRASALERIGGEGDKEGADGEEQRKSLADSLADFTAVAILGQFKDQGATDSVERVLKKIASNKAKEILRTREPRLPSPTFISAYLEAFRFKPHPELPENPSQGDQTLLLAYQAIDAKNYPHAFTLFDEAINQGLSNKTLEAAAYNMRGTFKFVIGNAKDALTDLERSTELEPEVAQTWVKKASVHMELSDKDEAFRDFDRAIAANESDPDIYYHRGQVHFIIGDYQNAMTDYQKSTALDDQFIFSHVQYAVALYKTDSIAKSTRAFQNLLKKFDGSSEAYNYYGELLLDQQKFEEALEKFDRAIEIESKKEKSSNVLPMINKALALFQWKQDMPGAEALCRQALEIDPDCDVAVATLAQLSLQQTKIPEAIAFFERSAEIARTEPELVNAITYEYASRAQLRFIQDFPEQGQALQNMAAAMP